MIETTVTATGEVWLLLEPKDLRIGNALMYKEQFVHVTMLSLDIDDEYEDTIGFCEWGKNSNEIADWNRAMPELKPIPLTAQMLEGCGFEYFAGGFYEKKLNRNIFNINIDIPKITLSDDYHNEMQLTEIPCIYLHQLQNLYFALTGEELKITLE
jgi:hypothetical protein